MLMQLFKNNCGNSKFIIQNIEKMSDSNINMVAPPEGVVGEGFSPQS
jgi:hypothetical protein